MYLVRALHTSSTFCIAFTDLCTSSLLYFTGLLRCLSISKVVSCKIQLVCSLAAGFKVSKACSFNHASRLEVFQHTSASSLPASFLYAFVHLTFLGFRFILKFLWHLLRQKLNTCSKVAHLVSMLP